MVRCGRSFSESGKVLGSLPLGFTEPKRILPTASAPALPPNQASRIAAGASTQGIVTGLPVSSTTMVWGLAFATAAISSSCWCGSEREGRSFASLSHW